MKVNLVVHDWGSYFGMLYENLHPDRVSKIVSLDVGLLKKPSPRDLFVLVLYQLWFAYSFLLSEAVSHSLGSLVFYSFFLLVPGFLRITTDKPARRNIDVSFCYLHFKFWMSVGRKLVTPAKSWKPALPLSPRVPACPMLFMYGTKKNVMLHDTVFLDEVNKAGGRVIAVSGGHWLALDSTDLVFTQAKTFLQ